LRGKKETNVLFIPDIAEVAMAIVVDAISIPDIAEVVIFAFQVVDCKVLNLQEELEIIK